MGLGGCLGGWQDEHGDGVGVESRSRKNEGEKLNGCIGFVVAAARLTMKWVLLRTLVMLSLYGYND